MTHAIRVCPARGNSNLLLTGVFLGLAVLTLSLAAEGTADPATVGWQRLDMDDHTKLQSGIYAEHGVILSRASKCPHDTSRMAGWFCLLTAHDAAKQLPDMKEFAKSGGRLLVLYSKSSTPHNSLLQRTFDISVATETVATPDTGSMLLTGSQWCRLWSGLDLLASGDRSIRAYLVPADPSVWTVSEANSCSTGKYRIVSAHRRLGTGEVLFLSDFAGSYAFNIGVFRDPVYELEDNPTAACRLFAWLAGLSNYY